MSQCVPNWEVEDSNGSARQPFHDGSNSHPSHLVLLQQAKCGADYEVTELTWENGHLAMHGLGGKERPRQGGTLESIVRQAAGLPPTAAKAGEELMPWLAQQRGTVAAMDALVPCSHQTLSAEDHSTRVPGSGGPPPVLSSARVGSCSASREDGPGVRKRSRAVTSIDVESESQPTTVDSTEFGPGSPTNTDDPDTSSYLSRPQRVGGGRQGDGKMKKSLGRSCSSIKRSRAAAIHNQSERKRRDRINQRMKTLQKLVPNSSKTDKASMLDEVIEYLKQLQAQVQMMSKISTFPPMMMPMAMQPMAMQQMQMAMMAQMGMGFGMGMGVIDINTVGRTSQPAGLPQVIHPSPAASTTAFLPMSTPWEGFTERLGVPCPVAAPGAMMTDSLVSFLAGQSTQAQAQAQAQPMTLDAYSRLAMLYQQLHQHNGPHHSRT